MRKQHGIAVGSGYVLHSTIALYATTLYVVVCVLLFTAQWLGLYKILFYFQACVHESIICVLPPSTCIARSIAILLHVYCPIYVRRPLDPPVVYAIHHTILVMAISCKGRTALYGVACVLYTAQWRRAQSAHFVL